MLARTCTRRDASSESGVARGRASPWKYRRAVFVPSGLQLARRVFPLPSQTWSALRSGGSSGCPGTPYASDAVARHHRRMAHLRTGGTRGRGGVSSTGNYCILDFHHSELASREAAQVVMSWETADRRPRLAGGPTEPVPRDLGPLAGDSHYPQCTSTRQRPGLDRSSTCLLYTSPSPRD